MPKIPLFKTQNRVNANPSADPTQSISSAGMVEGANAQLAGNIANFSNDLLERRTQAETVNFRNNSVATLNRESRQKKEELRQKYAGSDHVGYADEYKEWQGDRLNTLRQEAPQKRALDAFNNSVLNSTENNNFKAQSTEKYNTALTFTASDRNRTVEMGQAFRDSPDLVENLKELEIEERYVNENRELFYDGNKSHVDAIVKEKYDVGLRSTLDGYLAHGLEGFVDPTASFDDQIKEIDRQLNGLDPETAGLFKHMTPALAKSYRKQMVAQLKQTDKIVSDQASSRVKNLVDINMDIHSSPAQSSALTAQLLGDLGRMNDKKKAQGLIEEVELSYLVGDDIRSSLRLSKEDFDKEMADTTSVRVKELGNAARVEKYNKLKKAAFKKVDYQRTKTPKAFTDKLYPGLTAQESFKQQKALGLDAQYFTADGASLQADAILQSASLEDKLSKLEEFKAQMFEGTDTKEAKIMMKSAFKQMQKENGSFGPQYELSLDMTNKRSQRLIISNGDNPSIPKNFKEAHGDEASSLRDNLNLKLRKWESLYGTFRNNEGFGELRGMVKLEAQRLYMDGSSGTMGNMKSSVDRAVRDIVDASSTALVGSDGKYAIRLPKDSRVDPDKLKSALQHFTRPGNLKKIGVNPSAFGRGNEQQFLEDIEDSITIVNSKDGLGVSLLLRTESLGTENFVTKNPQGISALEDIEGEVIVVPFDEILDLEPIGGGRK